MTRRRDASGFTLIELLIVLCIISVLVRIALPAYAAIRRDSLASQTVGDLNVIRAGAAAEFEATGSYPPDTPAGIVPPAMAPYLPRDFAFTRPNYSLAWNNFVVSDTTSGGAAGQILALTVTAADPALGYRILHTLGANCTHWSVGGAHTFVLQSSLESAR